MYHDRRRFAAALPNGGWQESYYATHWNEHQVLAPSIAVYCETPAIEYEPRNQLETYTPSDALKIRFLNMVGIAFDHENQMDAKFFGFYVRAPTRA